MDEINFLCMDVIASSGGVLEGLLIISLEVHLAFIAVPSTVSK